MRSLLVSSLFTMWRRWSMWSNSHVRSRLSKNSLSGMSRSDTMCNWSDHSNCSNSNEAHRCALKTFGVCISLNLFNTDSTGVDFVLLFAWPSALSLWCFCCSCWCRSLSNLASSHHWSLASSSSHWCWCRGNWHNRCDWLWLLNNNNLRSLKKSLWCFFVNNPDLLVLFQSWVILIHLIN